MVLNLYKTGGQKYELQNQQSMLTSYTCLIDFFCRIASLMEDIVAEYIEGVDLSNDKLNETRTFISASKAITFSGLKASVCLV